MIRKVSFLSLVLLLCVASDCNPEPIPSAVLPENLVTIAEVDGSTVNMTATADNANFYSFTFYDGDDSTYQEASDGMASIHTHLQELIKFLQEHIQAITILLNILKQ